MTTTAIDREIEGKNARIRGFLLAAAFVVLAAAAARACVEAVVGYWEFFDLGGVGAFFGLVFLQPILFLVFLGAAAGGWALARRWRLGMAARIAFPVLGVAIAFAAVFGAEVWRTRNLPQQSGEPIDLRIDFGSLF